MPVVQMITHDRVGCQTVPVDVQEPLNTQVLIAAAAKKFKSVTKQSRAFHGLTGAELTGDVSFEELDSAFVVFSSKAGWKGAARLSAAYENEELKRSKHLKAEADHSAAKDDVCKDSTAAGRPFSDQILEAAKSDRAEGVVLFWKDTQDNGYLSNWAKSAIVIEDVRYNSVEQWIMACKARACGDEAVLSAIMSAQSARKQKGLGRSLNANCVQRHWKLADKWTAQLRGARAKFQQHEHLAVKLLATGRKPIAEASPSDKIFGIGVAPNDPLAQNTSNWRGTNILGKALMQVREELRTQALGLHAPETSFDFGKGSVEELSPGSESEFDPETAAVELELEGELDAG